VEFLTGCSKIAVLCVGNDMRGDDAAGVLVYEELSQLDLPEDKIVLFNGGVLPENYTKPIRESGVSHLLMIDAAEFGGKTGDFRFFRPEEIKGSSYSTHTLPLSIFLRFIGTITETKLGIIGIQPGKTELVEPPDERIVSSAKIMAAELSQVINNIDTLK
jgi:hydrogenase 3 maturation protease